MSSSLTVAQKYFITFKVNRADSNFVIGYSTNKVGIKFSTVKQKFTPINNFAHFYSNTVVTDKINWTKLSGSFIADSAYNYIMFGNFFDDSNTLAINDGTGTIGYYYIDEVCVSTDSLYAANYITDLKENNIKPLFKIYPSPASNYIIIEQFNEMESFKIFNTLGQEIDYEAEVKQNNIFINCVGWPSGLYDIKINNTNKKIIIKH